MRGIITFLISALFFFLQLMLAPAISIFGAKIDFIVISVTVSAFYIKKWYAPVICGLYSGLVLDILTQAGTFINTVMYPVFAILVFLFVSFVNEKNFVFFSLTNAALVALKYLVLIFVLYIMRLSEHLTLMTFVLGLPSVLYTLVAALGIYFVVDKLFSMPFMAEKKEEGRRYI